MQFCVGVLVDLEVETSVPSKVFELGPILQNFTKLGKFLNQNDSIKAENWLN